MRARAATIIEAVAIVLVCWTVAGFPPPEVNEPNYLAKAKHYWDPGWCPGDVYLESADTHLAFTAGFGWLTLWFELPTVAMLGRLLTWSLMAGGWLAMGRAAGCPPGVALLAAALFMAANHLGHLSGEWVVGGCEAKGFAYAAVFMALAAAMRAAPRAALMWCAVATALHVLVGGWTMVALVVLWALGLLALGIATQKSAPLGDRVARRGWAGALLFAAALVAVGLWPAATMNAGVPRVIVDEAAQIYVFQRLPHHLLPEAFGGRLVWHLCLVAPWGVAAWLTRDRQPLRRLNTVALVSLAISSVGVMLDAATASSPALRANVMRLYWFRSADALVPLAAAFSWVAWAVALRTALARTVALGVLVVLAVAHAGHEGLRRRELTDPRGEVARVPDAWRETCAWIATKTPADALCLTPRFFQTFKWYAGRPEVANWKEVPQDARSIVAWWQRMRGLYGLDTPDADGRAWRASLTAQTPEALRELAVRYGASYVVTAAEPRLALPCAYRNNSYAVYRVEP